MQSQNQDLYLWIWPGTSYLQQKDLPNKPRFQGSGLATNTQNAATNAKNDDNHNAYRGPSGDTGGSRARPSSLESLKAMLTPARGQLGRTQQLSVTESGEDENHD